MQYSWLFRQTHQIRGRKSLIDSSNSGLKYLSYGRIVLSGGEPSLPIETQENEVGLICLQGEGKAEVNGQIFGMKKYDALYLPRNTPAHLTSFGKFDLAECTAPVSGTYLMWLRRER